MNWDQELTELTPQRRQEREMQEQEQRDKNVMRGRRTVRIVVIVYVIMQMLTMTFVFWVNQKQGDSESYLFDSIMRVALVAVFARGLWLGRGWARNLFAVILVLAILVKAWDVVKLSLTKNDGNDFIVSYDYYSESEADEDLMIQYEKEMLAKYQEMEKERAIWRRRMIAAQLADIVIGAGYLYILLGYPPVKEYFERQALLPPDQ